MGAVAPRCEGTDPSMPPLPWENSPIYFLSTPQVEVRVHHAFIWDLFWHRAPRTQEMPGAQTDP